MTKAYWIACVTVTDPESYAGYQALAPAAFAKYGARFLARGGEAVTLEGQEWQRHVIIEFANRQDALGCYRSSEYAQARSRRDAACIANIAIVDGVPEAN